mgnify:FL=1
MPAPVLGVVARLLLSSGSREAAKKYGQAAVTKAREELAKYQSALSRRAAAATRAEGHSAAGQAARQEGLREGTRRGLATRLDRSRSGRDLPQIREEVPLKFAKGGSIDGKAIKGLTRGSRRK